MEDQIQEIQKALYRVRRKVKEYKLSKSADNPYFDSKYIPYEEINRVINDAFFGEGLVFYQNVTHDGTHAVVEHFAQSPEGVSVKLGETKLPTPKLTPQDAGSAFSYAKRYGAAPLFDLIETKDDDAEGAQQAHRGQQKPAEVPAARTPAPQAARPASLPKAPLREGKGWEPETNAPPAEGTFVLKGRTWILAQMNVKQLSTVVYTGDYTDDHRKLCNAELLKRVAANNTEAIAAVEANSNP